MNRSKLLLCFAALAVCGLTSCGKAELKVLTDFPAREAPNYQGLVSVN
jgi:hypothetical protein